LVSALLVSGTIDRQGFLLPIHAPTRLARHPRTNGSSRARLADYRHDHGRGDRDDLYDPSGPGVPSFGRWQYGGGNFGPCSRSGTLSDYDGDRGSWSGRIGFCGDALYMLKTDPVEYLVLPRLIACCLMVPALSVMALLIGLGSGLLVGQSLYGIANSVFLDSVRGFLGFWGFNCDYRL